MKIVLTQDMQVSFMMMMMRHGHEGIIPPFAGVTGSGVSYHQMMMMMMMMMKMMMLMKMMMRR